MVDRYKIKTAVYLMCMRGGKVLLSKRKNTGFHDGKFILPSGHVEANESLMSAMKRECVEELGFEPTGMKLEHVLHRRKMDDDDYIDFFFSYNATRDDIPKIKNKEPGKCEQLAWFDVHGLPPETVPYVRNAIMKMMYRKMYSEDGW